LALFAENVFYTAVLPLLPTYADRFELSGTGAGLMIAAYSAGIIASSVPATLLGRRLGFQRLAGIGLTLLGMSTVVFGLATSVVVLDLMRGLQGVGAGFAWIGALGWIASLAPAGRRGAVMGTALSVAIVGATLGPVVGGIAGSTSVRAVFGLLGAAQITLGVVILASGAQGLAAPVKEEQGTPVAPVSMTWPVALLVLPSLLAGVYEVMTPLHLDTVGAGIGLISAVFVASAVAEAVVAPLVGRLSDRSGRLGPLRVALLLAPVFCVALTADLTIALLAIVAVLAWVTIGAAWVPGMALVGDLSEGDPLRASRNWALVNVAISGGVAIGSIAGPAVAAASGAAVPYLLLGAVCAAVATQLWRAPGWLSTGSADGLSGGEPT